MKKWLSILLGVVTAIGGFLDAGTIATAGAAGAKFGLGLIWAIVIATVAIILLVEMAGRFAAVSQKAYAEAVREQFGFKFYAILLLSEIIAESLLLTAELGGMAIALALLTGISWHWLFPLAALLVAGLAWRAPFSWIENGPALLGLVVLAFPVALIVLGGPSANNWQTLWQPQIKAGEWSSYLYLAAAILGATISPYLLYFYSSGAVEEKWSEKDLGVNKVTAIAGMGFGSTSSIALVVLSAIVLQPLAIQAGTLGEIGLALAKPFGQIGGWLFAAALFITCLGAALEVTLGVGYMIAQGFGWEWSQDQKPAKAARHSLVKIIFLLLALAIGFIGPDPLQLALLASTVIALFLPLSLLPFLVLMNNRDYLGANTNKAWTNLALLVILVLAFGVAVVSLPLEILSGGG